MRIRAEPKKIQNNYYTIRKIRIKKKIAPVQSKKERKYEKWKNYLIGLVF